MSYLVQQLLDALIAGENCSFALCDALLEEGEYEKAAKIQSLPTLLDLAITNLLCQTSPMIMRWTEAEMAWAAKWLFSPRPNSPELKALNDAKRELLDRVVAIVEGKDYHKRTQIPEIRYLEGLPLLEEWHVPDVY